MKKTMIDVRLDGIADIMFDRFIDHSKEARPPEQKLYLGDKNMLVMPSGNIRQMLFGSKKPPGCAKAFEGKKSGEYIRIGKSHVFITGSMVPFRRNGDIVFFKDFDDDALRIHLESAVTQMSTGAIIKQEARPRPVLLLPWSLEFELTIVENDRIDEQKVYNWFARGGIEIALGTYRPDYGRFMVKDWVVR